MNHEARVVLLRKMTIAVHTETSRLLPGVLPEQGSRAERELRDKIAQWEQKLKLLEFDLKSDTHLRRVKAHAAPRLSPRVSNESFRASRARREAQLAQVEDVLYRPLLVFSEALAELIALFYGPQNEGHAILKALQAGLKQLADNAKAGDDLIGHELAHLQQQTNMVVEASGGQAPPDFANPGVGSPVGVLLVGLGLLAALKARLGKK